MSHIVPGSTLRRRLLRRDALHRRDLHASGGAASSIAAADVAPASTGPSRGRGTARAGRRLTSTLLVRSGVAGLVLAIAVTWLIYTLLGTGFMNSFNMFTLSQDIAFSVVYGFAQLVILTIGRMNLAVGAVGLVAGMVTGWALSTLGLPMIVGLALGLLAGTACGLLMGFLEVVSGIGSFIVTLAMLSVYTGGVLILTLGGSMNVPLGLVKFSDRTVETPYLSMLVVPALAVALGLWYVYRRSSLGWKMLAVGANERAARLAGVRVPQVVMVSFAFSGLLSAIAALIETCQVGAVTPSLGDDWLLPSFIIPVLGGALLSGGSVVIAGTVLAAVFLDSITTGLLSLNVPSEWVQLADGALLLIAVMVDQWRRRLRVRSEESQ